MSATGPSVPETRGEDTTVFDRILVGLDSTDESLIAAAQAGVLRRPGGELVLIAAIERQLAAHAGMLAPHAEDDLAARTSKELARASELADADDVVVASGGLITVLQSECAGRSPTLVAIGARPHRRLAALTLGAQDLEALQRLPASVLVARQGWGPANPDRIVIGIDGSPEASRAEIVARSLAARLGCDVVPAIGLGEDIDLPVLRAERHDAVLFPGSLLDAVVSAASARSLVVVGRTHGARGHGSGWAQRVVCAARCSVLVVQDDHARLPETPPGRP